MVFPPSCKQLVRRLPLHGTICFASTGLTIVACVVIANGLAFLGALQSSL